MGRHSTLKTEYEQLFAAVRKMLQQRDPLGLLQHGAPPDEYDGEIERIVSRARSSTDAQQLAREMHGVFVAAVGEEMAGKPDSYAELAAEIHRLAHRA